MIVEQDVWLDCLVALAVEAGADASVARDVMSRASDEIGEQRWPCPEPGCCGWLTDCRRSSYGEYLACDAARNGYRTEACPGRVSPSEYPIRAATRQRRQEAYRAVEAAWLRDGQRGTMYDWISRRLGRKIYIKQLCARECDELIAALEAA